LDGYSSDQFPSNPKYKRGKEKAKHIYEFKDLLVLESEGVRTALQGYTRSSGRFQAKNMPNSAFPISGEVEAASRPLLKELQVVSHKYR
jgi:hypothetical protein